MKLIASLKEIQEIELNILLYIDEFCRNSCLKYFLAGGTLLGAVRHKGFIPWDDDMDISMPRKDYDFFCEEFNREAERRNSPYRVIRLGKNCKYCYPFVKVVDRRTIMYPCGRQKYAGDPFGIFVDVFPIDGVANKDEIIGIMQNKRVCSAIGRSYSSFGNLTWRETLRLAMRKIQFFIIGREQYFQKLEDCFRKNSFDESPYVMSTYGLREEKEIIERECFARTIFLEFENCKFPAPVGYKQYLTQMYGDYMQLPPELERVSPHRYTSYWLEDREK